MQIHLIPKHINIYLAIPPSIFAFKLFFALLYGNMEAAGAATAMLLVTFVAFITIPNTVYAIYKALTKGGAS